MGSIRIHGIFLFNLSIQGRYCIGIDLTSTGHSIFPSDIRGLPERVLTPSREPITACSSRNTAVVLKLGQFSSAGGHT